MPRLFIRGAARWIIIIGIIGMYAMGQCPAIAAACEGGGEEGTIEATFKEEEAITTSMTITNPFMFVIEITATPLAKPGKGAITSNGTCTKGARLAALGGTCNFTQNDPVGAHIGYKSV